MGSASRASYYGSPWRPLIESAGPIIAEARDRGESVEQIMATIWTAIERTPARIAGPPSA